MMFYTEVQTLSANTLGIPPNIGAQYSAPAEAVVNQKKQPQSDLTRPVYCVLGLPIDAVDMSAAVRSVEQAASAKTRFVLSTPNLDFLVQSLSDPEFRETLLQSDLCTADGMPLVWIARLLGLPITQRVSGADLLETLRTDDGHSPLKLFFFGGADGVSQAAERAINAKSQRLKCVGALNPGFGRVEDLSKAHFIEVINGSGADFLIASLGAKKGQLWLHHNQDSLTVPVRAHLGAAINFVAGAIERAPLWCRRCGLEWLWRIKEEPYLWHRYAWDGFVLLRLLLTQVLPLSARIWFYRRFRQKTDNAFTVELKPAATIRLHGEATEHHVAAAIDQFELALAARQEVILDVTNVVWIDARFLGLILMFRKALKDQRKALKIVAASRSMKRIFLLHGVGFLLT